VVRRRSVVVAVMLCAMMIPQLFCIFFRHNTSRLRSWRAGFAAFALVLPISAC
jgi:hypothetical protein